MKNLIFCFFFFPLFINAQFCAEVYDGNYTTELVSNIWEYHTDVIEQYPLQDTLIYVKRVTYRCVCVNSNRGKSEFFRILLVSYVDEKTYVIEDQLVFNDQVVQQYNLYPVYRTVPKEQSFNIFNINSWGINPFRETKLVFTGWTGIK